MIKYLLIGFLGKAALDVLVFLFVCLNDTGEEYEDIDDDCLDRWCK